MECVFEANILCVNSKASFVKVFRMRTPAEAVELVSVLLEYTPSLRVSPLQACAHAFFDELRDPLHRLPNGRSLPPLFNFTQLGNYYIIFSNIILFTIPNIVLFIVITYYKFIF